MFTGIVEELGRVESATKQPHAMRLSIRGRRVTADARLGDSIAVNGVCLTIADLAGEVFTADVMHQTLQVTTLASLEAGSRVNLERAARLDTRLGGHLVQGHVDGTGVLLSRQPSGDQDVLLRFSLPAELRPYVVERGSIAVDGVSLTVTAIGEDGFRVSLTPTTLGATTLGTKQVGEAVNLEADIIAKYISQLHGTSHIPA